MSAVDAPGGVDATMPSYGALAKYTVGSGVPKAIPAPAYAIDNAQTKNHVRDDIVGWRRQDKGFLVMSAAANVGRYVRWTPELERPFQLTTAAWKSSLSQPQETLVLTYWTDGVHIENPRIGVGQVTPQLTTHETLDERVREELLEITHTSSSHEALEHLMLVHNIFHTSYLRARAPMVFRNFSKRKGFAQAYHGTTPDGHAKLGVSAYATFSSPLRKALDRGGNAQLWLVEQGQNPQSEEAMRRFAEYLNQDELKGALAQQEIVHGYQQARKKAMEYASMDPQKRTDEFFRSQGYSPLQAQHLTTLTSTQFRRLVRNSLRNEAKRAKDRVTFVTYVIENGRAPTKKELRAA